MIGRSRNVLGSTSSCWDRFLILRSPGIVTDANCNWSLMQSKRFTRDKDCDNTCRLKFSSIWLTCSTKRSSLHIMSLTRKAAQAEDAKTSNLIDGTLAWLRDNTLHASLVKYAQRSLHILLENEVQPTTWEHAQIRTHQRHNRSRSPRFPDQHHSKQHRIRTQKTLYGQQCNQLRKVCQQLTWIAVRLSLPSHNLQEKQHNRIRLHANEERISHYRHHPAKEDFPSKYHLYDNNTKRNSHCNPHVRFLRRSKQRRLCHSYAPSSASGGWKPPAQLP